MAIPKPITGKQQWVTMNTSYGSNPGAREGLTSLRIFIPDTPTNQFFWQGSQGHDGWEGI